MARMTSRRASSAHRSGAYQLFALAAGSAAVFSDPEVFRAVVRRIGFLDRTAVLDDDVALQERIERIFAELMANPRPPAGPPRGNFFALWMESRPNSEHSALCTRLRPRRLSPYLNQRVAIRAYWPASVPARMKIAPPCRMELRGLGVRRATRTRPVLLIGLEPKGGETLA